MSQRVNIQYSINIDELPNEVNRLVNNAHAELAELSSMRVSNGDVEHEISLQSISSINEMRTKIASIDHCLMDVANIMNGYINYLTTPAEQENQDETVVEPQSYDGTELYPANEVSNKVSELESKLNKFKSNTAQESYDPVSTKESVFSQKMPKTVT